MRPLRPSWFRNETLVRRMCRPCQVWRTHACVCPCWPHSPPPSLIIACMAHPTCATSRCGGRTEASMERRRRNSTLVSQPPNGKSRSAQRLKNPAMHRDCMATPLAPERPRDPGRGWYGKPRATPAELTQTKVVRHTITSAIMRTMQAPHVVVVRRFFLKRAKVESLAPSFAGLPPPLFFTTFAAGRGAGGANADDDAADAVAPEPPPDLTIFEIDRRMNDE